MEERAGLSQRPLLQGLGQLRPGPIPFSLGQLQRGCAGPLVLQCRRRGRCSPVARAGAVGIDLGLKDVATCSDGTKLENGRFYRDLEAKLAIAQRAGKKARTRAIHARIANRRQDALHQFSRQLVNRYGEIHVGDVSPTKLVKTPMAKSVLDAGWGQLKTLLEYKCAHAGIVFRVVDERYTSQACSNCGCLPDSRPKGIAGLGVREWTCSECGVTHDRDVNAARNILAAGHGRPVVGIPSFPPRAASVSEREEDANSWQSCLLASGSAPIAAPAAILSAWSAPLSASTRSSTISCRPSGGGRRSPAAVRGRRRSST
ncbi:RNA-guided endonuclease InsQ/TnpB family protein [Azotobacter chroococcum]